MRSSSLAADIAAVPGDMTPIVVDQNRNEKSASGDTVRNCANGLRAFTAVRVDRSPAEINECPVGAKGEAHARWPASLPESTCLGELRLALSPRRFASRFCLTLLGHFGPPSLKQIVPQKSIIERNMNKNQEALT